MLLKEYFQSILETVGQSIIVVDVEGKINSANPATASVWGTRDLDLVDRTLSQSVLMERCPDLLRRLQESRERRSTLNFECSLSRTDGESTLAVRLRPVFAEDHSLVGTIIYAEDITPREHLRSTIQELENTTKELQSANEELETANEELQSTNEELEAMNEELQSTNEELETANEELVSLNEELETMNEELQVRTEEMDQLNARYVETLERMPFPVMLLNESLRIEFWNSLAQRLFGFKAMPAVELDLEQLPISESAQTLFRRKHQNALQKNGTIIAHGEPLGLKGFESATIHFTQVPQRNHKSVLVMIQSDSASDGGRPLKKSAIAKKKKTAKKSLKKSAKKR